MCKLRGEEELAFPRLVDTDCIFYYKSDSARDVLVNTDKEQPFPMVDSATERLENVHLIEKGPSETTLKVIW